MKKLALVAVVAAFGFASCKKDYTCKCTIDGETANSGQFKAKKKDAKESCEALETSAKQLDAAATCTID